LSKKPLQTFHQNIRKSKSLIRLQFTIDDILETGGERSIRKYLDMMDKAVYKPIFGMSLEELIGSAKPPIENAIQKQVESIPKEEIDERTKKVAKLLEPFLNELKSVLEDIDLLRKKVLVEQAVVSAVTALEVYCGDASSSAVEMNEFVEKRFHPELSDKFGYEHLVAEGYEGRKALGSVAASLCKFYDIESLSNHFKRLLGKDILPHDSPQRLELKRMIDYRNLIVHQSGIVDQEFASKTGYKGKKGGTVRLTREMVEEWMKMVNNLAERIDAEIRSLEEPGSN
jgi:uncharacterized protein YutE (UPF0331/DUF86 family)